MSSNSVSNTNMKTSNSRNKVDLDSIQPGGLICYGGGRSESGRILSLQRAGYDVPMSCNELIDGAIDAKSSKIIYEVSTNGKSLRIIDNGKGMNLREIVNALILNYQHVDKKNMNDDRIGAAGIGTKNALGKLVDYDDTTVIYSKAVDGPYMKAVIPWKTIFDQMKWDGITQYKKMEEHEIDIFKKERDEETGVTIELPLSDEINLLLDRNFLTPLEVGLGDEDGLNLKSRQAFRYGNSPVEISLRESPTKKPIVLNKYNPFTRDDNIKSIVINISIFAEKKGEKFTGNFRFCYEEDGKYKFHKRWANPQKKGHWKVSKKPNCLHNLNDKNWSLIQVAKYCMCIPKNDDYFDRKHFKTCPSIYTTNNYDKLFLKTKSTPIRGTGRSINTIAVSDRPDMVKTAIIRSGQVLTRIDLKGYEYSKTNGGGKGQSKTTFKITQIKSAFVYSANYKSGNVVDNAICGNKPEENKTKFNDSTFFLPLKRLLTYLKDKQADIWYGEVEKEFFYDEPTVAPAPPPAQLPAPKATGDKKPAAKVTDDKKPPAEVTEDKKPPADKDSDDDKTESEQDSDDDKTESEQDIDDVENDDGGEEKRPETPPPPTIPNIVTELKEAYKRRIPIKVKQAKGAIKYIKSLKLDDENNIEMMIDGPDNHIGLTIILNKLWKFAYGQTWKVLAGVRDRRPVNYEALLDDIEHEYDNNQDDNDQATAGVHINHLVITIHNRLNPTEIIV